MKTPINTEREIYRNRVKGQPVERMLYLITNRITGGSMIFGDQEKESPDRLRLKTRFVTKGVTLRSQAFVEDTLEEFSVSPIVLSPELHAISNQLIRGHFSFSRNPDSQVEGSFQRGN